MPEYDDHDLERRLREQRSEAGDEFVDRVAAGVRSSRVSSQRPRLTLAFALSLAVLVSLVAFGGVGAASSAFHSSTAAVRSAVGSSHVDKARGGGSKATKTPAKHQYRTKVAICLPRQKYVVTVTKVTKYVWVGHGKKRHLVKKTVTVRTRTPVTVYHQVIIQESRVPIQVSKGALYPVPVGGCPTGKPATV